MGCQGHLATRSFQSGSFPVPASSALLEPAPHVLTPHRPKSKVLLPQNAFFGGLGRMGVLHSIVCSTSPRSSGRPYHKSRVSLCVPSGEGLSFHLVSVGQKLPFDVEMFQIFLRSSIKV